MEDAFSVLSAPRKTAGLNNKKLVLLGLRRLAVKFKSQYCLPTHLFDFTPTKDGIGEEMVPIGEVFNEAEVRRAFPDATDGTPTKQLTNQECIDAGQSAIREDRKTPDVARTQTARILASFLPSDELKAEANKILAALPKDICAVQLRIERDWKEHVTRKGWTEGDNGGFEIVLDHQRIFDKIVANGDMPSNLYICCDEEDLEVSKQAIIEDAKWLGLNLIFKSDFETKLTSRLKKSVVDFEICLQIPKYVGLTSSTFSNLLCMVKGYQLQKPPLHYVYDAISEKVERRFDFGREIAPGSAIGRR